MCLESKTSITLYHNLVIIPGLIQLHKGFRCAYIQGGTITGIKKGFKMSLNCTNDQKKVFHLLVLKLLNIPIKQIQNNGVGWGGGGGLYPGGLITGCSFWFTGGWAYNWGGGL